MYVTWEPGMVPPVTTSVTPGQHVWDWKTCQIALLDMAPNGTLSAIDGQKIMDSIFLLHVTYIYKYIKYIRIYI